MSLIKGGPPRRRHRRMLTTHVAPDDFIELDVISFVRGAKIHLLRGARPPSQFAIYRLKIDFSRSRLKGR